MLGGSLLPLITWWCVLTPTLAGGAEGPGTEDAGAEGGYPVGNVIFIHPDGAGSSVWNALRMIQAGPDGGIAWDRLDEMAVYAGHMSDALAASSHGGATTHAYGVRVKKDSFGMDGQEPIVALSGFEGSILNEAKAAGLRVGAVNSGHLCEPGTAVFLTSAPKRWDRPDIASRIVESDFDLYFAGGERYLLPVGVAGINASSGVREDGGDLRSRAVERGIRLVYRKSDLAELESRDFPVLGLFADDDTYYDQPELLQALRGQPYFEPNAPTVGEMAEQALRLLAKGGEPFFLVVEEEGTDNFANYNNAGGTLEAARRADEVIAVALKFQEENPNTLIVVAADSEAGGFSIYSEPPGEGSRLQPGKPIRGDRMKNGAPLDGVRGPGTEPFMSRPDAEGVRHPFAVAWAGYMDFHGGVIVRAHGLNAETMPNLVSNVEIYRLMYRTLFGRNPES